MRIVMQVLVAAYGVMALAFLGMTVVAVAQQHEIAAPIALAAAILCAVVMLDAHHRLRSWWPT